MFSKFKDAASSVVQAAADSGRDRAALLEGVDYDVHGQAVQVLPWIIDGERLIAVYDLKGTGSGFVAITDMRLIFYDKAVFTKKRALMSVPYSRITALGSVDNAGLLGGGKLFSSSELLVRSGTHDFEFEFRGADKAHKAYMAIMRELLQPEMR